MCCLGSFDKYSQLRRITRFICCIVLGIWITNIPIAAVGQQTQVKSDPYFRKTTNPIYRSDNNANDRSGTNNLTTQPRPMADRRSKFSSGDQLKPYGQLKTEPMMS